MRHHAKRSADQSNRCQDIVIFELLGCQLPLSWIFRSQICNGPNRHEGRTASSCQISWRLVKPLSRYLDFGFFKIVAATIKILHF